MATLTLRKGQKPVAFSEIDVKGDRLMKRESHRALKTLRTDYADMFAILDEDLSDDVVNRRFLDHDDYTDYRHRAHMEGYILPAMRAAWCGDGEMPTLDDLDESWKREIHACLVAIVTANPDLATSFPEVKDDLPKVEKAA